jgi:protein-disulfide isomerase
MNTVTSAILLLLSASAVLGQLPHGQSAGPNPIPSTSPQGFVYFNPGAGVPAPAKHNPLHTVVIEAFLDLQCPDSKAAYPIITQLPSQYPSGSVFLEISLFPLPYHHNAFYAAQAAQVVFSHFVRNASDEASAHDNWGKIFDFAEAYFAVQDSFTNVATRNLTADEALDKIASLVESSTGLDKEDALKGLQYGTKYDGYTRTQWKYGASRTVSGTPFFYVNGVYVSSDPSWSVEDWKTLIDPLVPATKILSA